MEPPPSTTHPFFLKGLKGDKIYTQMVSEHSFKDSHVPVYFLNFILHPPRPWLTKLHEQFFLPLTQVKLFSASGPLYLLLLLLVMLYPLLQPMLSPSFSTEPHLAPQLRGYTQLYSPWYSTVIHGNILHNFNCLFTSDTNPCIS